MYVLYVYSIQSSFPADGGAGRKRVYNRYYYIHHHIIHATIREEEGAIGVRRETERRTVISKMYSGGYI